VRANPRHASSDLSLVSALITEHPWATIVSSPPSGLVASHYPVLLDEESNSDAITLLTHVGRPDEELHEFGQHEILVVVQGHNGYVSPSWYAAGASKAPTWNFTAAHLHGRPALLSPDENLASLTRLVERFERHVEDPMWLDQEWGAVVARGTVGLRIPVSRLEFKVKMSQDKDPETVDRVIRRLQAPGPYSHPALAADMVRARERGIGYGQQEGGR
jgi:transcriptional regulator